MEPVTQSVQRNGHEGRNVGNPITSSPIVEVNGVNLYHEMSGETGDPLVLIHGAWVDHLNWSPVVPGLSKTFRVLTYDRRGHGKSQKVLAQGSFDEDADDAAALINSLDLSPAHVVGNSTGSIVALNLAAKQPTIIRSLTVQEPPLWDLPLDDPAAALILAEARKIREAVVKMLAAGDMAGGARLFAETGPFGPGSWDKLPPRLKEALIANADNFLDETKNPLGFTVELKGLSRFEKPTLLTCGAKSPPFFRPVMEKLAKTIPRSELFLFEGAGHMPHITHPEEFVSKVTSFARLSEQETD